MNTQTLTFNTTVNAPVEHVYYAFSTKSGYLEWFSHTAEFRQKTMNLYMQVGKDQFSAGRILEMKKNSLISFTWRGNDDPTASEVVVHLTENGSATDVTVEHKGLGSGPDWDPIVEDLNKMWEKSLENLKSVIETGLDQRKYRKPMMGVHIANLITPELAEKHNYATDFGLLLSGVLRGMGAEQVGMAKDDILLSINGVEIRDFSDVDVAINPRTAGDMVEMVYLRGAEKRVAQVELARRPLPNYPPTAQALSESLGEVHSSANGKFDELFEGVTERQTEFKPAPGEWNSKEVLAHLILTERDMNTWASTYAQGNEVWGDTSHFPARLSSVQRVFPNLSQIRGELTSAQDQTVALVADLPAEFVNRKSSFVRLAGGLLEEAGYHYKDHLEQVENNLVAAQGLAGE